MDYVKTVLFCEMNKYNARFQALHQQQAS